MSLIIINKAPKINKQLLISGLKLLYKKITGQTRGPQLVTKSLLRGLEQLDYKYKYNPSIKKISKNDVVYVNESKDALHWAIGQKKKKRFSKLIAGPAITVMPEEENSIMMDDNIDLVLQPSKWVQDYWMHYAPKLKEKIKVWAAGVDYPKSRKKDRKYFLVYKKDVSASLLKFITNYLEKNKIPCKIINYGNYKNKKYLEILQEAKAMIYLGKTESQSLAMCEAWMADVPVLVRDVGEWKYKNNVSWKDNKISAPYLTADCGMFFKGEEDFASSFVKFVGNIGEFRAGEYARDNFSYKVVAQRFVDIIS